MCVSFIRVTCGKHSLHVVSCLLPTGERSIMTSNKYEELGKEIGALVDEKNAAYGDSFNQAGKFLEILYPDGIPVSAYTDALCIVRIFDKLKRIATDKDALGENPYRDVAGYALLGIMKDKMAAGEVAPVEAMKKSSSLYVDQVKGVNPFILKD